MSNGSVCWIPLTNFANSLKKTSPSSNSKASSFQREQYLYLTTRGRKSGVPHEIEIWFTHHNGRFYVIAEYETSQWVRNLRANPTATVRVGKLTFQVAVRILSSKAQSELERHVQDLSRTKYGWGDGLVVELVPEEPSSGILAKTK
ncbi:MAG TPA: nitroreductase family deazaflavin-dependent oxidoreductase [Terriglobales bacterium]|nr:nitroreductase family deazaflavin-dependent oxidoreductase [Terriglobales bacterium]